MALRFSEDEMNKSVIAAVGNYPLLIPRKGSRNYFVDNVDGSDSRSGDRADRPLLTIQEALDRAETKRHTNILVYRTGTNYDETVSITKSNITLIALRGKATANRVTIAPTSGVALTTAASINNLNFLGGFRFVGSGSNNSVNLESSSSYFEDADFSTDTGAGAGLALVSNSTEAGGGCRFYRCLFRECGGAGILVGTGDHDLYHTNVDVWDSQFYGNVSSGDIKDGARASKTYFYQWDIRGNRFMTRNKTVYLAMGAGTASDCLISGNYFADDGGLNGTKIALAAGAVFAGNYDAAGVVNGSSF
jgi:hypothetical protein